ncbi:MAG: hypothetical protein IT258_14925 [Saprospiraceae bacterium]|nr:hypothetical protein [Saprospiraceae bacterium]
MKSRLFYSKFVLVAILAASFLQSCAPTSVLDDGSNNLIPHSDQSLFSSMNQQDVIEITLVTDLDSILIKRKTEDYQAAEFSYEDQNGVVHNFQAKTKPRGKFRRMTCDFPPLKLKFSKQELEAAGLTEMNEIKLVTHCLNDKDLSRDLIFREYLTYKLYNELTPNSLRVQLAKITYRDKTNPDYRMTRYGFLIEDEEEFGWRTAGQVSEKMGTNASALSASQEKLASVFQYMIGNTDWSIEMLRNVEVLEKTDGRLIPVPYDFDFSGVVLAPYARPNVDVGQKRVGERVFMGNSKSAQELYATLNYFRNKKEDLFKMVEDFSLLDSSSKEEISGYLMSFYQEIETQESAQANIFKPKSLQSGTIFQEIGLQPNGN